LGALGGTVRKVGRLSCREVLGGKRGGIGLERGGRPWGAWVAGKATRIKRVSTAPAGTERTGKERDFFFPEKRGEKKDH